MGKVSTYTTLDDIVALATFAHRNDSDQAGEPYINHPMRVLRAVQEAGGRPYVQMAAVLHDVTEDTAFTCDMLEALGVPTAAVRLVRLVDRAHSRAKLQRIHAQRDMPAPTKAEVDAFYYAEIRENEDAKLLKNCDMDDNTLPWRLSYLEADRQDYLIDKYDKGRKAIN